MLPATDVAALAREVVGPARILYVVREPVARTISHHHHYYAVGLMSDDIDADVPRHPELVDILSLRDADRVVAARVRPGGR